VDAWRALLDYGVERRELSHNVAASMKKVPRVHAEMNTYRPDEIGQLLRAADKDRSGHLWYLALNGLRRGEIAGLRWSDIDLDGQTVSIERSRVQAGAGNVVENDPRRRRPAARCHSMTVWSPSCAGPRRGRRRNGWLSARPTGNRATSP
jgi:integrase